MNMTSLAPRLVAGALLLAGLGLYWANVVMNPYLPSNITLDQPLNPRMMTPGGMNDGTLNNQSETHGG